MNIRVKIDNVNQRIGYVESFQYKYHTHVEGFDAVVSINEDGSLVAPYFYFSEEFVSVLDKVQELGGGDTALDRYINAHKATHSLLYGGAPSIPARITAYRTKGNSWDFDSADVSVNLLKPIGVITESGTYAMRRLRPKDELAAAVSRNMLDALRHVKDRKSYIGYRLGNLNTGVSL